MTVPVPTSRRSRAAAVLTLAFALTSIDVGLAQGQAVDRGRLQALVDGPQRGPANRARDPFRHPVEDLAFFGIGPSSTVVEILPGGSGYWTEILAPYLRDGGRYIAANPP